MTAGLRVEA